jgi:hypothetical protein
VSFARPSPAVAAYIPPWLRHAFLTVLVIHDLLVAFAGGWALRFQPAQLSVAVGGGWLDDFWGWLFLAGGLLSLAGAVSAGTTRPHQPQRGLVLETVGCMLVFGGYEVLGVATISVSLFGSYSIAGGLAFAAAGISSLRRIGRVWAGAFLAGRR